MTQKPEPSIQRFQVRTLSQAVRFTPDAMMHQLTTVFGAPGESFLNVFARLLGDADGSLEMLYRTVTIRLTISTG